MSAADQQPTNGRTIVRIETRAPYTATIGPGALDELGAHASGANVAVVSDTNVAPLHADRLGALAAAPRLELEPGEAQKSLARLESVLDFFTANELDRGATIVALGGGVVGDLAGLAASLFMRGVAVVQCPTSLLAQVDASIGGKTAVNLAAGKNLVGTFHQPVAVLADTETLATLPDVELRSGLGEVVKSALVGDAELFALLERDAGLVLARDPVRLGDIVGRCVRVKGAIVAADERESGERAKLNLGHTFAHAIEHAAGFGRIPHGEAVAVGLVLAIRAAGESGMLEDAELEPRLGALLARLGLAASLDELRARHDTRLTRDELLAGIRSDKKSADGEPRFVLPLALGSVAIGRRLGSDLLGALLA